MKENKLIVGGEAQVGLQGVGTLREREQKGTQRVFGFHQAGAAVGNDERAAVEFSFFAKVVPVHAGLNGQWSLSTVNCQ